MTEVQVPLYFVVHWGHFNLGSAKMRSVDLARIVAPHLGSRLRARVISMPGRATPVLQRLWARSRRNGGLYFMTKSSFPMDAEAAALLKARSHGLCLDYVDHDLALIASELADVHVCASYAQQDRIHALQAAGRFAPGPTHVILHNADSALYGLHPDHRASFSAVYCGNQANTRIPAALRGEVTLMDASKPRRMKRGISRLPDYALHYAVRDTGAVRPDVIKPFTKGVTAAVCHANVVTGRDAPDAVRLLGEDYPFLVKGTTDDEVTDAFLRAKAAFGGPVWRQGLDAMARLRNDVSGPALAAQLRQMAELRGVY
jgi:hypothetical protein